ncbi:MAG: PAS domain S-box protein [Bacteroidia bacterium]
MPTLAQIQKQLKETKAALKKAEQALEKKSRQLLAEKKKGKVRKDPIEKKAGLEYKEIVENVNDIIFNIDKKGYFTYFNPLFYKLTGYKHKEVIGKHFTFLIEPSFKKKAILFYLQQLEKKIKNTYFEFPIIKKDKKLMWVGQTVSLVRLKNKKNELIAVARNITDRVEFEGKHKAANLRLSALIENLQSGILLEDENRKIVLTNDIFCSLFSIPVKPQQLIGSDCSESAEQTKALFKDEAEFVRGISQILTEKKLKLNELLHLKDGRIFSRDYIPIFSKDTYLGHLWKYEDVTASLNTQDAIKRSEEKYRRIINNMQLGLLEVDSNGIIMNADERICEITGYSKKELYGKNAVEMLLEKKYFEAMKEQSKIRKTGQSSVYEVQLIKKDGSLAWIMISGTPLYNDNHEIIGSIGIHLDVTSQKRTEAALAEAKGKAESSSRAKEIFMANMSHEIRTPLNAILGMAGLLSETGLNEKQGQYLKAIRSSSSNLLTIINDILDLSKINSGNFTLNYQPFDLPETLTQSIDSLVFSATQKGLSLDYFIDENIPRHLYGDALRVNQVILNLLSNAIKFTSKGGIKIDVSLINKQELGIEVAIRVSDTGIGIAAEKIDSIFDSFTQEDESVSRNYGGTGLGLSISKQIVELMGGHIFVSSRKDIGSTFVCVIPFKYANIENASGNTAGIIDTDRTKGVKVLLVEDNPLNETIACEMIRSLSAEVFTAHTGLEAVTKLKYETFDIVLMDIQMPEMGGVEATQVIRNELNIQTPIIALTANAIIGDKEKYMAAGMNDYLSKPFEKTDLYLKIVDNLRRDADDEAEFSLKKLEGLSDGKFVSNMQTLFKEQTASLLKDLNEAFLNSDIVKVRSAAHQLKPSIDLFDIRKLKKVVRELETLDQTEDWKQRNESGVNTLNAVLEKVFGQMHKRD